MPSLPHISRENGRKFKPGPTTRISRSLTNEIIRSGHHPVAVMLDNMTFWHTQAHEIRDLIRGLMKNPRTIAERDRLTALLEAYLPARDKSEQCAKDLAPYIHPKLANISVTPETGDQPASSLTDEQLAEIAARAGAYMAHNQSRKLIDVTPEKE